MSTRRSIYIIAGIAIALGYPALAQESSTDDSRVFVRCIFDLPEPNVSPVLAEGVGFYFPMGITAGDASDVQMVDPHEFFGGKAIDFVGIDPQRGVALARRRPAPDPIISFVPVAGADFVKAGIGYANGDFRPGGCDFFYGDRAPRMLQLLAARPDRMDVMK